MSFWSAEVKLKDKRSDDQKALSATFSDYLTGQWDKSSAQTQYDGQLGGNYGPWTGAISKLLSSAKPYVDYDSQTKALQAMLSGQPAYRLNPQITKEYFDKAVKTPMYQTFDQEVAPRLREAFAVPGGAFSSRQHTAYTRSLDSLQTSMGAQLAQLQQQNQALEAQLAQNARQNQGVGLQLAPQMANQPINQASAIQQTMQPLVQQQQNNNLMRYQEWLRSLPSSDPRIAQTMGYIGHDFHSTYTQPSMLENITQIVGTGVGAVMGTNEIGTVLGAAKAVSPKT